MSNITRIGPLAVPRLIEPTQISIAGGGNGSGVPIKATFGLASRTDAECLEELVNNAGRRQSIGGQQGVLEWVETADALARWRGWWLLDTCELNLARAQIRRASPDGAYVPMSVVGTFLGSQGRPIAIATHRELTDDFGVAGQAMLAPLYPSKRVEGAGTLVSRAGAGGGVEVRKQSTKREALRLEAAMFDPDATSTRPAIRDASGVLHYGPRRATSADGLRLETAHVRVEVASTANNHWLIEGYIAGDWYVLGALRIRRTAAAAGHVWGVVGTTIRDDRASLLLANDYDGSTIRAELRVGELGMRLVAGASYYLQWLTAAEAAAGAAIEAANYYEDAAVLGNGAKRYIALVRNPLSESLPDWQTQIGAGHQAMVGFVPPAPGADDTAAEQARQFLYDRTELLTLE